MRLSGSFLILSLTVTVLSTDAAQAPPLALCDGIVARLQNAPQEEPWAVLTEGKSPYIEVAAGSEMKALGLQDANGDAEFVNRFITAFNPSDELREAWVHNIGHGRIDLSALSGSDLHVVTTSGGSALCRGFMFFKAARAGTAQLLPDLPLKSDRDGDNLICGKLGGEGYLARVGGVEAFLETHTRDRNESYRIVPLRDGKWTAACAVEAEYETRYHTAKAFAPGNGPLTETDIKAAAAEIVKQRERVQDAKDFSFGPPLSESEKEQFRTMEELAARLDEEPVPAFGRNEELAAGEETLRSGDSFPIVLIGRAYLLRIGSGQLGCCYFPGPLLIFYSLTDGKLDPVGAAVVEESRGSLRSAHATASR